MEGASVLFTQLLQNSPLFSLPAYGFLHQETGGNGLSLIPLIMFLFQFFGVINYQNSYVDKFDFWYALPVITPIIIVLIWISHELNRVVGDLDLKDEIEDELKQYEDDKY